MPEVSMTVNGKPAKGQIEGRTLLVDFLRDTLGLTGTHVGCDTSQCGACVVHVDGRAVKACTMFAAEAEGAEVRTIEGMAEPDGTLHPIQSLLLDFWCWRRLRDPWALQSRELRRLAWVILEES